MLQVPSFIHGKRSLFIFFGWLKNHLNSNINKKSSLVLLKELENLLKKEGSVYSKKINHDNSVYRMRMFYRFRW